MNVGEVVVGMKVVVSDPAYVTTVYAGGTKGGYVDPTFFGKADTVIEVSPENFNYVPDTTVKVRLLLYPTAHLDNFIDARFLSPVSPMTADDYLAAAGLMAESPSDVTQP